MDYDETKAQIMSKAQRLVQRLEKAKESGLSRARGSMKTITSGQVRSSRATRRSGGDRGVRSSVPLHLRTKTGMASRAAASGQRTQRRQSSKEAPPFSEPATSSRAQGKEDDGGEDDGALESQEQDNQQKLDSDLSDDESSSSDEESEAKSSVCTVQ